ncbi:MAG: acyl carrier protein [Paludibacteraceae bacterium]|nr:acyl carrier protein [Paludibacteraceae bacterium]
MEERILTILRNVFNDTTIDITCSQNNCKAWDSMNHLNLVVELEMEFGISLEPEEIGRMISYHDVEEIVTSKL